jgi:hypothetical protein
MCRLMPSVRGHFFRHCYLIVIVNGKPAETISGEADDVTGRICFADDRWDYWHYLREDDDFEIGVTWPGYYRMDDREYPFTMPSDACSFHDCACKKGKELNGAWLYHNCQDNSNRFTEVIRSNDEFCGIDLQKNKRSGAIPGAKHLEWSDLIDPAIGRFKSPEELRQLFDPAN